MSKESTNKDSILKAIGVVFLGILVLSLFQNLFFGTGMNMGTGMTGTTGMTGMMGMDNMHGGGGMAAGVGYGFSLSAILTWILMLLIKILSLLLVVALVIGLWVVVRDYLLADGENPFSAFSSLLPSKMNCPKCGSSVNSRWDYCPDCGQALTKNDKPGNKTIASNATQS